MRTSTPFWRPITRSACIRYGALQYSVYAARASLGRWTRCGFAVGLTVVRRRGARPRRCRWPAAATCARAGGEEILDGCTEPPRSIRLPAPLSVEGQHLLEPTHPEYRLKLPCPFAKVKAALAALPESAAVSVEDREDAA